VRCAVSIHRLIIYSFDYGDFKIFGLQKRKLLSKIRQLKFTSIAGTFKRTGDDEKDADPKQLSEDQKENSEHVMLVDLARNDLAATDMMYK
jgi:anthranilate synthase component 1